MGEVHLEGSEGESGLSESEPQLQPKMKFVVSRLIEEGTSYYSLADGTVLGVKLVVTKVKRVLNMDGSKMFAPNGNPVYAHEGQAISMTLSPDEYEQVRKS